LTGLTGAGIAFEAFLTADWRATFAIKRFPQSDEPPIMRATLPLMRSFCDSQCLLTFSTEKVGISVARHRRASQRDSEG
jgi:hypothetical protein